MPDTLTPRWANEQETAEYLGVTPQTVRRMVANNRLTIYRISRRIVRFDLNEVDAALKATA